MEIKNKSVDLSSLRIDRDANHTEESSGSALKWVVGIAGALVIIVAGYFVLSSLLKPVRPVKIVTASLTSPSQANAILTASGYIVPQRQAAVASKGTGRLVYLAVEEGDRVVKGQIIARLESNDVEARLQQSKASLDASKALVAQAEAELARARSDFDRNKALFETKVITQAEFDVIQATYKTAEAVVMSAKANVGALEAAVRAAEVEIENTVIRAPFDGTVLTKNADVGEIVAPFASGANSRGNVVTIADMGSLQMEADVSESNIDRVKIHQPCEIALDAFPEKRYRGVVWKIVPTADRAKATILTKIKFVDIDSRVLPEMSAKVTFLSEAVSDSAARMEPKLTIPLSAIAKNNSKKWVYRLNGERVEEVVVETGAMVGERIEVLRGLANGDKLVDRPSADLSDGDKVTTESK
jgi:RND family efflux transporter MFP subunit